jgi:putative tricarboxylic transport membrane protein
MLETLSLMGAGFVHALSPINLFAMFVSTAFGVAIGCLPGLSAAMGVALLLPVTFGMDPATGLIVLGGIYCGAIFGGSISAILIHTPGTPASAATAIEGYQMTKQGRAAKALTVACFASFMGGLLSCISLYFFAPPLAVLALKFKSPEYFWLSLFGLTVIAGVSSKSLIKGLLSGFLGLLISTIGMDPMEGVERYMFGTSTLYGGVNGSADAAAQALAQGNLHFDPDAKCDHHGHHHGEDHDCGHHGHHHGEGHECGHHGE